MSSSINNLVPKGLVAVTASDSAVLSNCVGLYCVTAGTVAIVDRKGQAVSVPMAIGQTLTVQINKVMATGTTGTYLAYQDA